MLLPGAGWVLVMKKEVGYAGLSQLTDSPGENNQVCRHVKIHSNVLNLNELAFTKIPLLSPS